MFKIKKIFLTISTFLFIAFIALSFISIKSENVKNSKIVKIDKSKAKVENDNLSHYMGAIDSGKTIYEILKEKKVSHKEVMCLIHSFKDVYDLRKVRENQKYSLILTPLNKIRKFTYNSDILNKFVADRKGNQFKVYKKDIQFDKKIETKSFKIEDSLYNSIVSRNETPALVAYIADIFSWDIDFYLDPKKGDQINIVFEKIFKNNKFVKYGRILSAQYISKRKTHQAFLFKNGKYEGYYDEKGRPLRKMFLKLPLKFGRVTSRFSIRRFHPVDKRYKAHNGIDYGAPTGTPIYATADGTVRYSGRLRGYGKTVILKNHNGYKTYYAHCSRLLVRKGRSVKQGQLIARVGRTGKVTGPHVHYEIRYKNRPVNPSKVVSKRTKPISKKLKSSFMVLKDEQLKLLRSITEKDERLFFSKKSQNKNVRS